IEAGYRYTDSPAICREPGVGPDPDSSVYVPTTWPGARLPHVWLDDGTALADRLGLGYSILRLGDAPAPVDALVQAMRAGGTPVDVIALPGTAARR
ncbi:MAG: 2-polyprenyl-6-methoxyphenol hydroxylase, partial [Candidatus Baltobacteraceae bacterium]